MHLKYTLLKKYIKKYCKTPQPVIVDLGGWAQPLKCATHIVDVNPYETRGVFGKNGSINEKEKYSKNTWLITDFASNPLPFKDKQVDFINFTGTLEDIKDPIKVLYELFRVSKSGYIEFPRRSWEQSFNTQSKWRVWKKAIGFYNHRCFIDFKVKEKQLIFTPKYDLINHLPKLVIQKPTHDKVNIYEILEGDIKQITSSNSSRYCGIFWKTNKYDLPIKIKEIPFLTAQECADDYLTFKNDYELLSDKKYKQLRIYIDYKLSRPTLANSLKYLYQYITNF